MSCAPSTGTSPLVTDISRARGPGSSHPSYLSHLSYRCATRAALECARAEPLLASRGGRRRRARGAGRRQHPAARRHRQRALDLADFRLPHGRAAGRRAARAARQPGHRRLRALPVVDLDRRHRRRVLRARGGRADASARRRHALCRGHRRPARCRPRHRPLRLVQRAGAPRVARAAHRRGAAPRRAWRSSAGVRRKRGTTRWISIGGDLLLGLLAAGGHAAAGPRRRARRPRRRRGRIASTSIITSRRRPGSPRSRAVRCCSRPTPRGRRPSRSRTWTAAASPRRWCRSPTRACGSATRR